MKKKFLLPLRPSLFMALTLSFAASFYGCSESEEFPEVLTEEQIDYEDEVNDFILPYTRAGEAPYPESPTPTSTVTSYWDGSAVTKPVKLDSTKRVITIEKAEELAWISKEVDAGNSFENYTITLNTHIDLGGFDWKPIGTYKSPFKGHFNGAKFVISNLNISGSDNQGLFAYCKGISAAITNTIIKSGNVKTKYSTAGGICAQLLDGACIAHCTNGAIIAGKFSVGGIVGSSTNGKIYNSHNTNNIEASSTIPNNIGFGGICGSSQGTTFEKCTNKGNISVPNGTRMGGICGKSESPGAGSKKVKTSIYNCSNSGNISGGGAIGGIWGSMSYGTIEFSTNSGIITSEATTGGIVGSIENESVIVRCDNLKTGIVTGTASAGGISGSILSNSIIKGCSNLADITGGDNVGGIVGNHQRSSVIASCNRGNVKGKSNVGGVSGVFTWSKMIACYNRGEVSADHISVGGIAGVNLQGGQMLACYNNGKVTYSSWAYSGGVSGQTSSTTKFSGIYWINTDKATGLVCPGKNIIGDMTTFSSYAWPSAGNGPGKDTEWGLGNGEGSGKYWRSLGSFPDSYPILYFEQLPPI